MNVSTCVCSCFRKRVCVCVAVFSALIFEARIVCEQYSCHRTYSFNLRPACVESSSMGSVYSQLFLILDG